VSTPLLLGIILALASLAYVFYPIVGRRRGMPRAAADARPRRSVTDEEIEAVIRAHRDARVRGGATCLLCGPRPEADAAFCSTCGRRLDAGVPAP
jgi:hypothetical protein